MISQGLLNEHSEVDAIISGGRFPLHNCPRVNNQVYIVTAQTESEMRASCPFCSYVLSDV